ncbi:Arc family DNA-binding protein [Stutzerimonas nitrititolerans]|uniref:Arc family DNA-binding protein n=1 Tax=Stutzerimonas nitrititolerans TaxID=2482751 RepID=UPI0028994607|nr:Arc family DNA-binding protein [Stutzerimonas nitrititolerans]
MSRTDQQFKLRMPAALRAQVERSAWAARRSLNAEIVIRLESSFAQAAPSTNEKERSA